jgi:ferrochelatase
MSYQKTAVLLLAHGSPESPADVPEFLRYVTGGRPIQDAVIEEVRRRHQQIGGSPLTRITLAQASALERELGVPVYTGMRNWKPFIADTVRRMMSDGVDNVVAICLAPQNSSTSVGLYRKALMAEMNPEVPVHFIDAWHDHPPLVRAFSEKLDPAWRRACAEAGAAVPVVFTAHSVPTRTIQAGDPYEQQAKQTAELVARSLSLPSELHHFAFQSQGMSGGPWLGPTVESALLDLKRQGHKGAVIAPVGFVCDHVEVLYDVDIGFREFAAQQNLLFWRTESLNTSPVFIAALAGLATSRLGTQPVGHKA